MLTPERIPTHRTPLLYICDEEIRSKVLQALEKAGISTVVLPAASLGAADFPTWLGAESEGDVIFVSTADYLTAYRVMTAELGIAE